MLELLEVVGGVFDLLCSWRFWICFMMALVVAKAISSSSGDSTTGIALAVTVMIVGVFGGWMWNKSATGSKIP
jgi:hypothetical protein